MASVVQISTNKPTRACDNCRIRKRACRIDGDVPCDFCFRFRKPCVFTDATNRRKRKDRESSTGNHVNDSHVPPGPQEDVQRILNQPPSFGSPSFDDMQDFGMIDLAGMGMPSDGFNGNFMFEEYADTPGNISQPSQSAQENRMGGGFIDLDGDVAWFSQSIGHTSDMDAFLLQQYRFDESGRVRFKKLAIQSLGHDLTPTQFLLSDRSKNPAIQDPYKADLEDIISHHVGDRLIGLYQRFISHQYPVFGDLVPSASSAPPLLLSAIYLSVEAYTTLDEQLSIELAYEGLPRAQIRDIFYSSLGQVFAQPSLSTVQALFLMVIFPGDPLIFEAPSKWTLFGLLVTCAHTIGLHLDPSSWHLEPDQISLRQTLSALIYSSDKLLAASFGKPPLLHSDNWLIMKHIPSSTDDPAAIIRLGSTYLLHTELGCILDRVLRDLYSLRALNETGDNPWKTMERARPLLEDLRQWHRSLVEKCKERPTASQPQIDSTPTRTEPASRSVCELGYHFVRILVLRAVFRPFVNRQIGSFGIPPSSMPPISAAEARMNARLGIKACTTDAVNFIRSLKQEDSTYTFWPSWAPGVSSSLCYLLLLMVVTADDYADAAEWLRELQTLRSELRIKSRGLPVLRLGLLRIDSIFWKGVDNVINVPSHVQSALVAAKGVG